VSCGSCLEAGRLEGLGRQADGAAGLGAFQGNFPSWVWIGQGTRRKWEHIGWSKWDRKDLLSGEKIVVGSECHA
jgi:hypothetical protein